MGKDLEKFKSFIITNYSYHLSGTHLGHMLEGAEWYNKYLEYLYKKEHS